MTSFPIGSRVVLHGLKKEDFNGKRGVVRTAPSKGYANDDDAEQRQQIFVDGNSYNLKVCNLKYEEKSCASLSIKEMKTILSAKGMADNDITGLSKSELISTLEEKCADAQERSRHIAEAEAKAAAAAQAAQTKASSRRKGGGGSGNSLNANNLRSQADQFANMTPAQLMQQAQALRTMPAAQIRRMNPSMATFSDAQIAMAAQQMEMMASNPGMMKQAAEQMKSMDQSDLEKVAAGAYGAGAAAFPSSQYGTVPGTGGAGAGGAGGAALTPEMMQQAQQQMSQMSPEQLRTQAELLKTMTPSQIRASNPMMAAMSDAEIAQATSQFEMMAANPELMRQTAEQMKGMSPEDLQELRKCQGSIFGNAGEGGVPTDPSQMDLSKMDPKELKKMLGILKKNPAMLKSLMSAQPGMAGKADGMSDEQLSKMIDGFDGLSENQIAMAMKAMSGWQKVNSATGGYLGKIILFVVVLYTFLFVRFAMSWMFGGGSAAAGAGDGEAIVNDMLKEATMDAATATLGGEPDEFGEEL